MDSRHFDAMVRSLIGPRRSLLAGIVGGALAMAGANPRQPAAAGKRKPLERNEYGCVPIGKGCRGNDNVCCSGICEGKKPKKGKRDRSMCLAHDVAGCKPGQQSWSCGTTSYPCTTSTGNPLGGCQTTTGDAGYCAAILHCLPCRKDADCQSQLNNPLAACIGCVACAEGTACVETED